MTLRLNDCAEPASTTIDLRGGQQVLIDVSDLTRISGRTLYVGSNGYVYFSIWRDGRSHPVTLHTFLVPAPPGHEVDHFNGDKLDNRRGNLRPVTRQRNQVNRRALNQNNRSGVRGVCRPAGAPADRPWRASICVARKSIYLGDFPTLEAATTARRNAEIKYFGELCPTNAEGLQ